MLISLCLLFIIVYSFTSIIMISVIRNGFKIIIDLFKCNYSEEEFECKDFNPSSSELEDYEDNYLSDLEESSIEIISSEYEKAMEDKIKYGKTFEG